MERRTWGAALVALALLAGCDEKLDGDGWSVVKLRDDRPTSTVAVVQVDRKFAQDRRVYDAAVSRICNERTHGNICIVGFFLAGNPVPDELPSDLHDFGEFVPVFGEFVPVAVWRGNDATGVKDFTRWDCEVAGVKGAPPQALCGPGVSEAYGAVVALGTRQGIGEYCGWPARADIASNLAEVLKFADPLGQRTAFQKKFDETVAEGRVIGTTNPGYGCQEHREKIDALVDRALGYWRAAIKAAN
jgi:hypothetical protein